MKFIVDAHLPPALVSIFRAAGHDAMHTRELPLGNCTTDRSISELAVREDCVVVTKDTDFYYSHVLHAKPPKLLLVRTGNMRATELLGLFEKNLALVASALGENSLVEIDRLEIRSGK